MAFYHLLKSAGPAARVGDRPAGADLLGGSRAGARRRPEVVFADVDPATFTIDPAALERAVTPATRAVVPTHLYGLPCDMDGDHGGRAPPRSARDRGLRARARRDVRRPARRHVRRWSALQLPDAEAAELLRRRHGAGPRRRRLPRACARQPRRCRGPTSSASPAASSSAGCNASSSGPGVHDQLVPHPLERLVDRRESRRLPVGDDQVARAAARAYTERFPNVQAAIGLEALKYLDRWTEQARRHARVMDQALGDLPGITVPAVPPGRTHVYLPGPRVRIRSATSSSSSACGAGSTSRRCTSTSAAIWSCSADRAWTRRAPRRAAGAMQVPVYSSPSDAQACPRRACGPGRAAHEPPG